MKVNADDLLAWGLRTMSVIFLALSFTWKDEKEIDLCDDRLKELGFDDKDK